MKITDLSILFKRNLEKSAVYQILICPTVCTAQRFNSKKSTTIISGYLYILEGLQQSFNFLFSLRKKTHELIRSVTSFSSTTHVRQYETEEVLQKHTLETGDLQRVKDQLKTSMKNKYERLFEGLKLQENESLLSSIYTQVYIIEG